MACFFRIFAKSIEESPHMNISRRPNHYWRNVCTRMVLIIITVLVIVWFLPRRETRQFRYDIGKPWMYSSFIAKFDFPIYKSEETLQHERDSLLQQFQPYFRYDPRVEQTAVAKFRADFKNGIPGLPRGYVDLVADRLHRLYQAGVMQTGDYNGFYKDSTTTIRVMSGKSALSVQMGCLYSTMGAYEKLFTDTHLAQQRQILQRCNLNEYIEPNLIYDRERSETERNDLLSSIPPASGMVMSGQKVIDRGDIINEYDYRVLNSFEREMQRRNASSAEITSTIIGQVFYVFILVLLFTAYLALFRKDYFEKARSIMMLYSLITIFPILVSLMMSHNFFSVYIIPFAMAPIFIQVFMDDRTAFIAHVTMILICAAAVKYQYEFIIVQLTAGLIAIYSNRELSSRGQIIRTALLVTLGSAVVYLTLQLMQNNDTLVLDRTMYIHFTVNGVLLLLANPLMLLIEKIFGFTSSITLIELSNTNKGVLRDLSEIAPGTFTHSITAGNLAAEIANRIGADSLLVRTGALYHDIGKMLNPAFFTENQKGGLNPHDRLPYKESAKIIIGHVTDGVHLAEKYNLPAVIKNFILTHHGTGLVKYFYVKYCNDHPDEVVDKDAFRYPGPNPSTKEQAILMMADTVEAASRSWGEYTEENIRKQVDTLVDAQVKEGFFRECPITFRDIALAKGVLVERMKAIYHTRIAYPKLKSEGRQAGEAAPPETPSNGASQNHPS